MYDKKKLANWMRRMILTTRTDGTIIGFEIVHLGVSGGQLTLDDVPYSRESVPDMDEYIEAFMGLAAEDAINVTDTHPGSVQTFAVKVMFDGRDPVSFGFRHVNQSINENSGGSEPANSDGIVSMLMRHTEAKERLMAQTMQTLLGTMTRQIDQLASANEKLMEGHLNNVAMQEEMLSRQTERNALAAREELKGRVFEAGFEKVSQLLPILVWKVTGKNILGATETPTEALLEEFVKGIDEDQFNNIVGEKSIFKPAQQQAMLALFMDIKKRVEDREGKKEARKAKILADTPSKKGSLAKREDTDL